MTFTMEDFVHQYIKEHFPQLTPEEQREALERLSPEQRREVVQSLSAEERLAGLPAEERLAGLPVEERLAGLSEEQIRRYLDQLNADRPTQRRKPRRKK
jgi:Mg/Co/Ni transporter MgtE